jgi:hypothetical protein
MMGKWITYHDDPNSTHTIEPYPITLDGDDIESKVGSSLGVSCTEPRSPLFVVGLRACPSPKGKVKKLGDSFSRLD